MASVGKGAIFLILFLLWCGYIVIGIFVFSAAEGNVERTNGNQEQKQRWNITELRSAAMEKHNMTAAEFDALAKKIREMREFEEDYQEPRWDYFDSFWFVFVLLTTIGYGDLTPFTYLGKALCVVYAIFGIPITILLLRFIGQQMLRGERALITAIERCCLKRISRPPCHLNKKCFMFGFVYLLLLLVIGAAVQMKAEGWSYGESFYFYVVTFTTVGFGDFYPQKAKYITIPFIFLGLTAISNILHALAAVALIRRVTTGSQEKEVNEETLEKLEKIADV